MRMRIRQIWEEIRSSMAFLPALLTAAAALLALMMVRLDDALDPATAGLAWLVFGGGPEGAQGVLSAIASSVVTVAGVTFSVTIVALTLASQQFTPRVIRQFTADRGIQAVLGVFLGTFVYALLVLRTVRGSGFGEFIPHFAVTMGVLLAVVSLGMLLYFIHHVSQSIQVGNLLSRVAAETHTAIDHLFPQPLGWEPDPVPEDLAPKPHEQAMKLRAGSGYLQSLDRDALMETLREHDLFLRMERRIGEFVPEGAVVAQLWPVERLAEDTGDRLARCFSFGSSRTLHNDAEFGVVQVVDIAVKALSPGINDPTTAVSCIQHLTGLLIHLGTRRIPSPYREDASGVVRVKAFGPDWHRMLALSFDPIRHYGQGDARVLEALIYASKDLLGEVEDATRRAALWEQLKRIEEAGERSLQDPTERESLRRLAAVVREEQQAEHRQSGTGPIRRPMPSGSSESSATVE